VRVIDDEGNQIGIMNPFDATKLAREKSLDLVEISPTAQPPVCRIMNYGKYLYQLNKKAHEAKKHQKVIQVKEVKFRPMTDDHDYEFKKNNIIRFLEDGDKVKAGVMFRGREMAHKEIGRQLIGRLIQDVANLGQVEGNPKMEGSNMFVIFAPRK
jgi:translation initiation factor IF-3